jgi:hypothetical protein
MDNREIVVHFLAGARYISLLQTVQLALDAFGVESVGNTKRCCPDVGTPAVYFGGIGLISGPSLRLFVLFIYR